MYIAATASNVHVSRCTLSGVGVISNDNLGGGVNGMDGTSRWSVTECDISGFAQGITAGDGADIRIANNYIHDIPGQHGIYDISSLGADNKDGGDGENKDINGWEDSKK